MIFSIDPSNGTPVYEQISRQLMFAVACGALKTGEMIPSVRQLARELVVNPNTVSRAYRTLQDDGIVTPIRGTGLQIAAGAGRKCQTVRKEFFRSEFRSTIDAARQSEIGDDEILSVFQTELQKKTSRSRKVSKVNGKNENGGEA